MKTKRIKRIITFFAAILCFSSTALAADSLLANGELAGEGVPDGWEAVSYSPEDCAISVEDGVVTLSSDQANDVRLRQYVAVEENTSYVLSAEISASNVMGGRGATLSIDNYSVDGSYLYSESLYGTNDWTTLTLAFRTAKDQESVVLALRLGGYSAVSSGTVWFRNVAFEASDNAPVAFQNLTPTESASTKGARSQEDYENLFTVIFWAGAIAAIVLLFGFRRRAKTLETMTEPVARRTLIFWLLVLIGLLVRLVLCAKLKGHATDIRCWPGWGAKVATQGTHAFYVDNWCDYPPGYMLVCGLLWRISSLFANGPESVRLFVYMLPAFACDVVSGGLLLHERRRFGLHDSLALLRQHFPEVKVIELGRNWGFAEGYNRALEQIDAEYHLLLNSDIEVTHHWLTPLVEFMEIGRASCRERV